MQPLVSVIIPVYNAEKYLKECVESLLKQTLTNAEFIFVDDGSSDRSLEMLYEYRKNDSRIQVYTQKNQSAGVARNKGVSCAVGECLTFLDSDDIMAPDALEMLFEKAKKTNADMVICRGAKFETDPAKSKIIEASIRTQYLPEEEIFSINTCSKHLLQVTTGAPWGKLYRTEMVKKYDIQFPVLPRSEDIVFVYEGLVRAETITTVDRPLIFYRVIENSGSLEDAKDRAPLAIYQSYQILAEYLKNAGLWELMKQSFVNAMADSMCHNLKKFKTGKAFEVLSNKIRNEFLSEYEIALEDEAYFYNKLSYEYIKRVHEYEPIDHLYMMFREQRDRADRFKKNLDRLKAKENAPSGVACSGRLTRWAYKIESGLYALKKEGLKVFLKKAAKRFGL